MYFTSRFEVILESFSSLHHFIAFVGSIPLILYFMLHFLRRQKSLNTVAFFHPYCNAGGGGERVLWCAIRFMQKKWPDYKYYVYSGDIDASKEQILMKAKHCFGIEVDPSNLEFIFLQHRNILEAKFYLFRTLLGQIFAGLLLGLEAYWKFKPEIFIDTMGYSLAMPIFKWFAGSSVIAYVHYPTISCDMIDLVERRESTYNNSHVIANSQFLSATKLFYYKLLAFLYGASGRTADIAMANSSWTKQHIAAMWKRDDVKKVFPPCDVKNFTNIEQLAEELFAEDDVVRILSIGQIRPEKNHKLQLEIVRQLKQMLDKNGKTYKVQLTIVGGCRGEDDDLRVKILQEYANKIQIEDNVRWMLNIPFDDLLQQLSESLVSLHTMWNEHFGISVVEGMAAGTVMLAHNSGGPKMDIVVSDKASKVGFLATTADEFATEIAKIISLSVESRNEVRKAARASTARFSEEEFDKSWFNAVKSILH